MIEYPDIPRRTRTRVERDQFVRDLSDAGEPRIADLGAGVVERVEIEHPLLSDNDLATLRGWWQAHKGEVALLRSASLAPGGFDHLLPIVGEPREIEVNARRTTAQVTLVGTRIPRFAFDARFGLGPYVTFARASAAWYWGPNGTLVEADVNEPRFEYDPATKAFLGLLCEPARTNLILGSDDPDTQDVTTSAANYAVSFFGTGDVVLSGTASATLNGTGANERTSEVVTASAGTLTVTITGDVRYLNVEQGPYPSSPIITAGSPVTRSADTATVSLTAPWYTAQEGTWVWEGVPVIDPDVGGATTDRIRQFPLSAGSSDLYGIDLWSLVGARARNTLDSPTGSLFSASSPVSGRLLRYGYVWSVPEQRFGGAVEGDAVMNSVSVSIPTQGTMRFGRSATTGRDGSSHTRRFYYLPKAFAEAELAKVTEL